MNHLQAFCPPGICRKAPQRRGLLLPSQPNDILQYRLDILTSIAKKQAPLKNCVDCGCKMPPDWL